ncbi:hypothetical protein [Paenibacillus glycanilyticus]|uniref:Uncharacterized protein n=1 Tax=Paenibacillus glycanilyticus TaxID=126569 RepID=A0ABQ6GI56_9BACL|nr:hypothetical protein [Paenibacillus glycanilyticus]GLX70624.1 hypothetical protein MU1_49700 [Paenibacillus glycanilyticus]
MGNKSMAEIVLERHIERRKRRCESEMDMLALIENMPSNEYVEQLRLKHTENLAKQSAALAQLQKEMLERFGKVIG